MCSGLKKKAALERDFCLAAFQAESNGAWVRSRFIKQTRFNPLKVLCNLCSVCLSPAKPPNVRKVQQTISFSKRL